MLIQTSQDILLLTIAGCVALLTFFMCWILYYVATIFREGHHLVTDIRKKIELVEGVLKAAKEKISQTSSYLKLLVEGVETATHFMRARHEEHEEDKKRKK